VRSAGTDGALTVLADGGATGLVVDHTGRVLHGGGVDAFLA